MLADDVLKASGDFGPAQWLLLSLFSLVNVLSAFHYYAQTFITLSSDRTCHSNSTVSGGPQFATLTSELGWLCDEEWNAAVVQSLFFVGSVVGTLVIGYTADLLGRRPMLVIANILAAIGNLLTTFVPPNLVSLSGSRFIAGLAVDSNFFMMYILVMEYISPGMRTLGLNLCIGVWYCVGCMVVPWVAVLSQDWRTFLTSISIPMLAIPLLGLFLPESAQWLISRGRHEDALDCYKQVAKINRKKIPEDFIFKFRQAESSKTVEGGSIRGLFATPNLRRKTCILIFKTMVLTLCYDAISRNIEGLGFDPFTMFTVASATIFPSCVVILLLQDKMGRKAIAVLALLLTGLLNLVQAVLLGTNSVSGYTAAAASICSRFAVNIAYNSGTQYTAELIPTQVRGQGLSLVHVVGYVATFFSPHVLYLSNAWPATPEVVLGILALVGAALCLFLPETLGRTLPTTLADGEAFGEDDNFWFFQTRKRNKQEI